MTIVAKGINSLNGIEFERQAIEEVTAELDLLAYNKIQIPLHCSRHHLHLLPLASGKLLPALYRCNGANIAQIYDKDIGYVIDAP